MTRARPTPNPVQPRFRLSLHGQLRVLVACGAMGLAVPAHSAPRMGTPAWFNQLSPATADVGPTNPGAGQVGSLPGAVTPEQAQQQVERSLRDLRVSLERLDAARQAQRTAQLQGLSLDSDIPDGHTAGGLMEAAEAASQLGNAGACINAASCLWVNAELPTESIQDGRQVVTVEQTGDKSVLTWDSLRVGRNTTLHIDQTAGTQTDGRNDWVSLNRVSPGAEPTVIQGQIKAEGSVYLINQNGVLFGAGSQVNVNSLLVSTLPLYLPNSGGNLAESTEAELLASNRLFLQSGLASVGAGSNNGSVLGLADTANLIIENSAALADALPEDIVIERGATISVNQEGFALIAAPNIFQQGRIAASDSQVVLAAGAGVMVNASAGSSRPSFSTGGRISDASQGGADITPDFELHNDGVIESLRGSVALHGTRIDQDGVILATTSVARQGSIDIQARDLTGNVRMGAVTLGADSLTAILPDDAKDTTNSSAAANSLFKPQSVSILGAAITLDGGALIEAPGHGVSLTAVAQDDAQVSARGLHEDEVAGRVYLAPEAVIDVAGLTNIEVPLSDVLVRVPRLGLNEFADSPLQRDGPLFAGSVVIDSRLSGTRADGVAWVGSPLANLAGYVEQVPRGVRQLLSNGGKIELIGGEVIGREGSVLNFSGGYTHYLGGILNTTRLLTASGSIVDIGSADPNVRYVGFAGQELEAHPRWNADRQYFNPTLSALQSSSYQPDDIFGGNAGSLIVFGQRATLLASQLDGHALAGRLQIAQASQPQAGAVSFGGNFGGRVNPSSNLVTAGLSFRLAEQLPPDSLSLDFDAGTALAERGDDAANLDDARWWTTVPVAALREGGIGRLSVLADVVGASNLGGEIVVDAGTQVSVVPGGSINLSGSRIRVAGDLLAPAGSISLLATGRTYNVGSTTEALTPADSEYRPGDIVVEAGSRIDVAGIFVNDAGKTEDAESGRAYVNGGSIKLSTLQSSITTRFPSEPEPPVDGEEPDDTVDLPAVVDLTGSIRLSAGSLLDASSGAWLRSNGQIQRTADGVVAGRGGSISLQTYSSPQLPFGRDPLMALPSGLPSNNGRLLLGGELRGFGFSDGASLSLRAPEFQIGGSQPADRPWTLVLAPEFFTANGFGSFELFSEYDARIAADTIVRLQQRNLLATIGGDGLPLLSGLATGTALFGTEATGAVGIGLLDDYRRQAVDFSLYAGDYLSWGQRDAADLNLIRSPDLSAAGITGSLVVGRGAQVLGDAGARLLLGSQSQLTVLGSLVAHGGKVTLTVDTARGGYSQLPGFFADGSAYSDAGKSIWLGPDSLIDVSGIALIDSSPSAQAGSGTRVTGRVLDGGDVVLSADNGYVIAVGCNDSGDCPAIAGSAPPKFGGSEGGGGGGGNGGGGDNGNPDIDPSRRATINVAGAAGTVSVLYDDSRLEQSIDVFSDAGSITVGAASGLYFNARLQAQGGSSQARGGSLTITPLNGLLQSSNGFEGATRLLIGDRPQALPEAFKTPGQALDATALPNGEIYFGASVLDGSGMDSLNLGSNPELIGNVDPLPVDFVNTLSLNLGRDISINTLHLNARPLEDDGSDSSDAIRVALNAPYVALHGYRNGSIYENTRSWSPDDGRARLDVNATNIDFGGHLALDGYRKVTFSAQSDIRFLTPPQFSNIAGSSGSYIAVPSVLQSSADTVFSARRLYPATGNTAYIIADNRPLGGERRSTASISFLRTDGGGGTPLSVGGRLLVMADEIKQSGALYAPGGQIYLGLARDDADFSNFALLSYPVGGGDTDFLTPVGTRKLKLGADSITSVSLAGLVLPYGQTLDGQNLFYNNSGDPQAQVDELLQSPEKLIGLTAAAIDTDSGAVVNLSGGGDLIASEWVAGTGGSRDVLSQQNRRFINGVATQVPLYADNRPVYAIVPGYSGLAPFDPAYAGDPLIGQSVYLNGAPGLPEGNYVLLPAHYALLPGAFRLVQDTRVPYVDALVQPGTRVLADGTLQIGGYFRDSLTGSRDALSSVFQVQSAATWQQYSEYQFTGLNDYFSAAAAEAGQLRRAPGDAGKLSLLATTDLTLDARILASAPQGRAGAELQVAAPQLQIRSGSATPISNYLSIDAERLNSIGASRIVLGATSLDFLGVIESFSVIATDVDIATLGAPLRAGEIVIATRQDLADDGIVVRADAGLEAVGTATGLNGRFITIGSLPSSFDEETGEPLDAVSGDGAFLQVSVNRANTPSRDYLPGQTYVGIDGISRTVPGTAMGQLRIGEGARLVAPGSLSLEASGRISLASGARLDSQALTLSLPEIRLSGSESAGSGGSGLQLGPRLLAELSSIDSITLIGRDRIRLLGDVSLAGQSELVLDTGLLISDGGTVKLSADQIRFRNSEDQEALATAAIGSGRLQLSAERLLFGASRDFATLQLGSNLAFSGFSNLDLTARQAVIADGDGQIEFGAADVNLKTPLVTARSNADLSLHTGGGLTASRAGLADKAGAQTEAGLGARLSIEASHIAWNTRLETRSGQAQLSATRGDLDLGAQAELLAQGSQHPIFDTAVGTPGGSLQLQSALGDLRLAAGSRLDVSAGAGGADAGSIQLSATQGAVELAGALGGQRSGQGQGAELRLDSGAAVNLGQVASRAGEGGIDGLIAVHSRSGNLELAAGQTLKADQIHLVADAAEGADRDQNGWVRIAGRIDASGERGGRVELYGEHGVGLTGSIDAHGRSASQRGGQVTLGVGGNSGGGFNSRYGYQTVQAGDSGRIELGSAAVIDVRGGSAHGHDGGELLLRAPLLSNGGVAIDVIGGSQILGDASPTLEAYARWDAADSIGSTPHFDGVLDPAGSSGGSLGAQRASFVIDTLGGFIQNPGFSLAGLLPADQGWRSRVGIDLVNSSAAINGGDITVASAWNLAAGNLAADGTPQLLLRTGGVAPALSLRALGDLHVSASLSDGFFQVVNPFSRSAGTNNSAAPVGTSSNPLPLATASLLGRVRGSDGQWRPYDSSSFRLVAGAETGSVDPLAVLDRFQSSADVLIDGQQRANSLQVLEASGRPLQIVLPTMVRTGVGSIDVAAAGDLRLLDPQAPGVIYTAGYADVDGLTQPASSTLATVRNGQAPVLDSSMANATGAGDIRIRVGGDIVGISQVVDTDGSRTGSAGTELSQYWWPWMQASCLTTDQGCSGSAGRSSINYAMFAQGLLSSGGDVDVGAGGSIREFSVSLPTTFRIDGSAPGGYRRYGGGDLRLSAGADLLGGSLFVSDGEAQVRAAGRIGSAGNGATLLGLQDASLRLSAGRDLDVGGVFNPSYLFRGFDSQSYSTDSSVELLAISGNLVLGSLRSTPGASYGANVGEGDPSVVEEGLPFLLPASLSLAAPQGTLSVQRSGELFPAATGQLSLLAQGDIRLAAATNNSYLGLIDAPEALLPSVFNPVSTASALSSYINSGAQANLRLHRPEPLHAQDLQPLRIYSELGDLVNGDPRLAYAGALRISSNKPADLRAGRDIINLYFSGQNLYRSDITRIAAGRDIYEPPLVQAQSIPLIELGGPGSLVLSAGRDIGPLTSANQARDLGYLPLNNPQYPGIRTVGNANNAYLAREGANISLNFGVANGLNLESFAETYLNPAVLRDPLNPDDPLGAPDNSARLVAFVQQRLSDAARREGRPQPEGLDSLTPAAAWTQFKLLPEAQRQQLVTAVFLDLLDQVGLDYNGTVRTVVDAAHPQGVEYNRDNIRFIGQYGRGYEAIDALFPASSGYTENDLSGNSNGALARRRTGELDMRGTTVQTQAGGDISILGPGGRVLVGSASAPPFAPETANTAAVGPNSQGLLTLQAGSIRLFADDSVLLAQSRIFTQQGGDILIWSSNGDVNAGKGAKTSSEIPPLESQCDDDLFCIVDARSQVSGAGIAALQSKPGAAAGSANLIAPVGTVDAGDAGIRVSGNLNVAALQVANADNIQVSGVKVGVPTGTVDTGVSSVAAASAAAAAASADQAASASRQQSNPELELFVDILVQEGE